MLLIDMSAKVAEAVLLFILKANRDNYFANVWVQRTDLTGPARKNAVAFVIDGIAYSHYFTSGVLGRPVTSAQMLVTKKHMSCFAGHQQGRQIAYARRADGKEMTAIIAGSCYEHDESYMGPQGNEHWRGFYMLHEVDDGAFDEMAVSINYLRRTYGQ